MELNATDLAEIKYNIIRAIPSFTWVVLIISHFCCANAGGCCISDMLMIFEK